MPRTNRPSDQHQSTSEQDPISFTNSVSKKRSLQAPNPAMVNCASCGQHSSLHTVIGVEPHIQPAKELNEIEANILFDIEFKVMLIGMLNSMEKDIETIIKKIPIRNEECSI